MPVTFGLKDRGKGGGRGVNGKLDDGTNVRIRFKNDGSARLQIGKDKFSFDPDQE